ncbi:MAG: response regulator [Minisyncoccia bacterium]|jgi:CheY-like chemotaxis protein
MEKGKNKLILLVDDDQDFLEILSTKLKDQGFNIETAKNGKEALEKLQHIKPDLIILDVMMPEMDGIDTAIELAKNFNLNEVKFIFLTNYGEDNWPQEISLKVDENFAKQIGALAYIRKQQPLENIIETLNKLLE